MKRCFELFAMIVRIYRYLKIENALNIYAVILLQWN